jgi:hemolysin activation/secretion protein
VKSLDFNASSALRSGHRSDIRLAGMAVAVLGCLGHPAFSQTFPDAGSLTPQGEDFQPVTPKAPAILPQAPEASPKATSADTTPIPVKTLHVTGATVFPAATLEALVADQAGGKHTLGELQVAAARITTYYRTAGYFLARAYLPPQQMQDGVVTIAVVEGRLSGVELDNASKLSDATARARLAVLPVGAPLQKEATDRALLLLSDLPGVGGVDSRLAPGANPGETTLVARLREAPGITGRLEADNYGVENSGRYRYGAAADASSLLGYGERFSARVLGNDMGELAYAHLGAQLPVGADGLTLGFGLLRTQYSLGGAFANLNAVGWLNSAEVTLRYPLLRSANLNVYGQAGLEGRRMSDEIGSFDSVAKQHATVGTLSLTADWRDALGGGSANQASVTLGSGQLGIDSSAAAAIDALGPQTAGHFNKFTASLDRQQALVDKLSLAVKLRGQWADSNLTSSEKFSLGGNDAVRAYPTGEAPGDRGWLATGELRYAFTNELMASVFYDAGGIEVNAKPYLPTDNRRHLSGAGIGFAGAWKDFDWRLAVAWRITSASVSEDDQVPRGWMQVGWRF